MPDPNPVLQEIDDLIETCSIERIKIFFGFVFVCISAFILYNLAFSPPTPNDPFWPLFALLFSIAFGFMMFGLNLLFGGLTSNAAKNKRFQDTVNRKLDRLLQGRAPDTSTPSVGGNESNNENDVLIAIRDNSKGILEHLKNPNREDRALAYSNTILAFVAAIVALTALGKDMYIQSGLPLQPLWVGLLCLLLGGIFTIYYDYSKWTPSLLLIGISVIGILYVGFIIVTAMLSGVHIAPQTIGNITNICENCTYPITNTVNNNHVTVVVNCSALKNSMVSVEELNQLMMRGR